MEDGESILEHYFELCKKGEAGVMPYYKGQSRITFVWTNGKGWGRECIIDLRTEGKKEALKLYEEIEELNSEGKK